MPIRRDAVWLTPTDERILEYLAEEPWASLEELAEHRAIRVSKGTIRERCRVLASVDFVAFRWEDERFVELTTTGALYLDGQADADLREPSRDALRG